MSAVRVLGALFALAGLVLMVAPALVSGPAPEGDTFAAIERRVVWGGLAGLGAFLVARTRLRPWTATVMWFVLYVTAGLLLARLVGLAIDGLSDRQWIWIAVEAVIVAIAGMWLWRKRGAQTRIA